MRRHVDGLGTTQPRDEALYRERGKQVAREGSMRCGARLPQRLVIHKSLLPSAAQGRVKLNQRLCLSLLNADEIQLRGEQG